jgi:hypothetical protein
MHEFTLTGTNFLIIYFSDVQPSQLFNATAQYKNLGKSL